jgi:hypothetical protein
MNSKTEHTQQSTHYKQLNNSPPPLSLPVKLIQLTSQRVVRSVLCPLFTAVHNSYAHIMQCFVGYCVSVAVVPFLVHISAFCFATCICTCIYHTAVFNCSKNCYIKLVRVIVAQITLIK